MVQLQVVKLVTDQLGITVELFDSNGIATRFEVDSQLSPASSRISARVVGSSRNPLAWS